MKMQKEKKYSFGYLKNIDQPSVDKETCYNFPALYDYGSNVENYVGVLKEVRDIAKKPLSNATLRYSNPKGKRSLNLCYFELEDGSIKGLYDGSMVAVEEVSKVKPRAIANLLYKIRKPFQRSRKGAMLRG